jgi:hypothetical protein
MITGVNPFIWDWTTEAGNATTAAGVGKTEDGDCRKAGDRKAVGFKTGSGEQALSGSGPNAYDPGPKPSLLFGSFSSSCHSITD